MRYAEIVVNVPIRRTFAKKHGDAPPIEPGSDDSGQQSPRASMQVYHYHLPVELETVVCPGHLVWVPFARQQVQGIVLRLSDSTPVQTKALLRLARPEPVLNQTQLTLAAWIADYYVAPYSEAIKLFIPPGLISKDESKPGVQSKRETRIELALSPSEANARLLTLGRSNPKAEIVSQLLTNPLIGLPLDELQSELKPVKRALRALQTQGVIELTHDSARLLLDPNAAHALLLDLRGASKLIPVINALSSGPLWKSELYQQTNSDLAALRTLQQAGLITLSEEVRFRDPMRGGNFAQTSAPPFTSEQQKVWQQIESAFSDPVQGRKFLLHGVTGSGKTEIYLRSIERTLALGKQVIVLVPEIALTPQTVQRFAGRFPGRVTVIHSELSAGERYDVWRALRNGEFDIVIGPRSALFAPFERLGLIVIDEEHESSYKQDSEEWGAFTVFYDTRKVAWRLADLTQSLLIFGSATPSLELYDVAKRGELHLLEMPRRVRGFTNITHPEGIGDAHSSLLTRSAELTSKPHPSPFIEAIYAELPPVEVVDMRQELRAGNRNILSRNLLSELQATLDANEQAILFLNRRGTNTFIICRDCGHVEKCKRCDAPLVYHEPTGELTCHHCNRRYPAPAICPECQSKKIKYFGSGTERIEDVVQQLVPQARLLRWDADTTSRKGSHEEILRRFTAHEADVLVGTQMIAKGLDLPLVTLVGVIAADIGLHMPDFRAAERTFQLLTQVAGRAGRSERGGRVVIQTYSPQHYAIQAAARHDFAAFYEREMGFRREHGYPPTKRMARLIYWDKNLAKAREAAERMAVTLRQNLDGQGLAGKSTSVLGPAPAFFAKFRGFYRWQVLIRAPDPASILRQIAIPLGWRIDIDPNSML